MSDQNLEKAKDAIKDLLEILNVTSVVTVDDANELTITLEKVIASCHNLEDVTLLSVFPEFGDRVPEDPDVRTHRIRQLWATLDKKEKTKRGKQILLIVRQHDTTQTDDLADVTILAELIPQHKLVSLTPEKWEAEKEQLLQPKGENATLFLFDQNLSGSSSGGDEGIRIIASLIANESARNLICGLLTHTITPESQQQSWIELSEAFSIPRDRFVVIPKQYLSRSPLMFANLLKFTALSPDFTQLKETTKDIISKAAQSAARRVDDVSIYDLDHIVFHVSNNEGLWEPDMLFRLHSMFHRMESRRLAHEGGSLETIASKLRKVSGLPMTTDLITTPNSAWTLQREELYENDHINKNHLPIELGDIFEKVNGASRKKYILLAQPCDIMVRSNGKRQPELERLPLLEIVPENGTLKSDDDESMPVCRKISYSVEMPYFDTIPTNKWFLKLKGVHFAFVNLIDLCVFNQDGIAKISVNDKAPAGIRPSWNKRYDMLSKFWLSKVKKAIDFKPIAKTNAPQYELINNLLFKDDLFNGNYTESDGKQWVTFDCKRIGRLSHARALGMLMEYTANLGRPAYDRDFGIIKLEK